MEQGETGEEPFYQTRVIVNPKNAFSLKPVCALRISCSGLIFDCTPPVEIPFEQIRSARVSQLTDGVIEHGKSGTATNYRYGTGC